MPLIDRRQSIFDMAGGALPEAPTQADPSFFDTVAAEFRQNNSVVSTVSHLWNGGLSWMDGSDKGYDVWNDIKGTPYESRWDVFAQSNNQAYTRFLKAQVDREDADQRTTAASGWIASTIGGIGANVLDPVTFIPVGGEVIKGAKGAYKLGDVALRSAMAAGIGTVAQEGLLHASQEQRTLGQSAVNVGSNMLLAGFLGAGVSAVLGRKALSTSAKGMDGLMPREGGVEAPLEGGGGLSAAPTSFTLGKGALTVDGTASRELARATQFLNPNMRLNFSPSGIARQIGQDLAENTMYQAGHLEGLTSGASVERLAAVAERGRMAEGVNALNTEYRAMKQAGISMGFDDFDQAVGRAMRAEDVGENQFVSNAAKQLRAKVVEPFFNDGKAVGLYEDGDDVSFAPSYFPRQYRTKVLIAKEPEIKAEWAAHLEQHIAGKYQEAAQSLREKSGAFDQQIADLSLSPEAREQVLPALEKQGDALEATNSRHLDTAARIAELRREKPAGWQDQVDALKKEGGDEFASFLKQRSAIRSRQERVDFGYAGLEGRQARIAGSIAKLEDANQRGLKRLVSKGAAFQRLSDKLDPKKLAKEMSSLKTSFADVLARSEKAMDRTARAAERLGEDAPAGMAERLASEHALQQARHEKLTRLAERIEQAEQMDPQAQIAAARDAIDETVSEVADVTARRADRVSRLIERQKALDPKRITEQVGKIAEKKAAAVRRFLDTWEIHHLGENIDPFDPKALPQFKQIAGDIVQEVYGKLTGRDYGSSASVAPEYMTPIERGPVKERTLPIPDWLLQKQGVLNDRASEVLHRYSRTLAADVELTRKFGDPRIDEPLKRMATEYDELRKGTTDPKELQALHDRQEADQRDIEALRDLVRGTYRAAENNTTFARVVRASSHFNFVRSLGGVVISSLSDLYRPAMTMGLQRFMGEGVAPLLKNLDAVKLSVKEAKLAGTVIDRALAHRVSSIAGIADPMERGTPVERMLENMSRFGAKWSGINLWTDFAKSVTAMMSQNRILDGSAGKRTLAYLGIDDAMGKAIRAQFAKHGTILDGVHVANTERWTDQNAVRAFRAAVGKDTDSTIVTPGVGDTPLFAHTPIGRLLLQFKSFTLASHQRVLIRGMQEGPASFTSGLVGMTSIGLLSAYLRAFRGGQQQFDRYRKSLQNPGFALAEGLDNSGLFTVPFDVANTAERTSNAMGFSFNPIKYPMMALGSYASPGAPQTGKSVRFAHRNIASVFLGPTAGVLEDVGMAAGAGAMALKGKPVPLSYQHAAVRLIPYNSYFGMREAIQALYGDSPYQHAFDGKPSTASEGM